MRKERKKRKGKGRKNIEQTKRGKKNITKLKKKTNQRKKERKKEGIWDKKKEVNYGDWIFRKYKTNYHYERKLRRN